MPLPMLFAAPVLVLALSGCSGEPFAADSSLSGCVPGMIGSIGIGVVNSGGDPISIEAITANSIAGADVVDRWFTAADVDEIEEGADVIFGADRLSSEASPTELDGLTIEPGDAGYVTIAIERTGAADGVLDGVTITTDGRELPAPVSLRVSDSCD